MRRFVRTAILAALAVCFAGLTLLPAASALAQGPPWTYPEPYLAGQFQPWGTWVMRLHLPEPPAGPGGSLPMILTIQREGTAVTSSSLMYGGLPPLTNWSSAVHDVWERVGPRAIESTCVSLSFSPGTAPSQPGRLLGFVRNRVRLERDGDDDRLVGELNNEFLACPTQTACPDVNDPMAQWTPRLVGVPVTAVRLVRVPPGPLP